MEKRIESRHRDHQGFTLVEVMIALGLYGLVMAATFTAYVVAARMTRAGGYQVQFNKTGRITAQKIARHVEQGKALTLTGNGVDIMMPDFTCARIAYVDGDGNQDTVADNRLIYDPDISTAGGEEILCTHVTPLPPEPMFVIVPESENSLQMTFHIGDGTNSRHTAFSGTGLGYQGVEMRLSVTPRNLQRWYNN